MPAYQILRLKRPRTPRAGYLRFVVANGAVVETRPEVTDGPVPDYADDRRSKGLSGLRLWRSAWAQARKLAASYESGALSLVASIRKPTEGIGFRDGLGCFDN